MKNLFFLIVCFLLFSSILLADTINVPADQPSIQAGINAAVDGDIVLVADSTYYENINFKGKAITVASHFLIDSDTSHISATIIDGSQRPHPDSGSVVYFISGEDTNSVLYGFTVINGTGTAAFAGAPRLSRVGGGIFINNSEAKISNNFILNNTVADSHSVIGGGLTVFPPFSNSFVIVENNIFDSNYCLRSEFASNGGGMFITNKARICNNTFSNNFVSSDYGEAFGGGFTAAFTLDSILIYGNLIINNEVETLYGTDTIDGALGGGIMIYGDYTANVRITNNRIAYNEVSSSMWSAGAGACFEDINGDILFSNNLVYENLYSGTVNCHGTGIGIQDNSVLRIINNTITGNEPSPNGGALSTWNTISTDAINNIFWGNSAGPSMPEIDIWAGPSPKITYCDVQTGWTGIGNISVDPLFVPGDPLFHLGDSSRCIGRGTSSYNFAGTVYNAPEYDFEGNIRPHPRSSKPDIGAMENLRGYPLLSAIQIPDDYSTIQAGIDAAENGDTVLVADSTYYENIIIQSKAVTLASYFLMNGDTSHISRTIINGSQPINADNASVIMIFDSPGLNKICGFTLTGGSGKKTIWTGGNFSHAGGGIYIEHSSAEIINNHIINNSIVDSSPQAVGTLGGGIMWGANVVCGLTLKISGNLISGNEITGYMTGGAGINISNYVIGGELDYLIEKNVIENNTVFNTFDDWKAMGGGIFLDFCLPTIGNQTIRNNIIRNNRVICPHSFGGGLYFIIRDTEPSGTVDNDPGPYVYNNIISENHSDYLGGGVSVWRAYYVPPNPAIPLQSAGNYTPKPSFVNNTIVNNTALDGSGFYIMNHIPFLMNNILWNDYPDTAAWGEIFLGDEPRWVQMVEPNIYGGAKIYYTDIQDTLWPGIGNIKIDPLFVQGDSLYKLSDASLCLNTGIDSVQINSNWYKAPIYDYSGNPRPQPVGTMPDMGAWESDILNSLEELKDKLVPQTYNLKQNYPNPFNPTTTIEFSIPKTVLVTIKIYNVLGQEVATLVSDKLTPGNYKYTWDASGFASGIYFYKIEAGGFVQTEKLILLR